MQQSILLINMTKSIQDDLWQTVGDRGLHGILFLLQRGRTITVSYGYNGRDEGGLS